MQNEKIRVLMFGWEFPPAYIGGLGIACQGLTASLARLGTEIIFVLPRTAEVVSRHAKFVFADGGGEALENESLLERPIDVFLYPYVTEEAYRSDISHREALFSGREPYRGSLYEEVLRYAGMARSIAREERFDIIHAHDWLSFPAGIEAKKETGRPLIVHVHATEFDRTGGQGVNERVYAIEREGMERADGIIAVSRFTKRTIVDRYGIDPDKVRVVHNGIDAEFLAKPPLDMALSLHRLKAQGDKLVLYLGRLTLQKGPDYFIRAAKRVLERRSDVTFLVVGTGDMERELIRQVAELGISDRVLFAGFLKGHKDLYAAADLYVMPSISEPFGLTALEAMASGTPVLISKQSGVSETAANVLKVDFWDIDEMANEILSVLEYGSLCACLSENGYREVQKITWREASEKCLRYYHAFV